MKLPKIKSSPNTDLYLETASKDLPVYPNGQAYHTDCTCRSRIVGRTMIDGHWVKVCMACGSLRYESGT
jgi:hypothetical protein